nr:hypothetical protein [Tanacetum cinerariifolium]
IGYCCSVCHIDAAQLVLLVKVIVPSTKRRRGVVIRDPEEESSAKTPIETTSKDKGKGILVEESKPMKKKQQVELDEAFGVDATMELKEKHQVLTAASEVISAARHKLMLLDTAAD